MLLKFIKPVYAHCDLPCGIYETDTMRHAADTCVRMLEKIQALPDTSGEKSDDHANFVRAVQIKEKHAQACKEQIYTLWSDHFKPEHIQKMPNLHETMWQAAKQCSKVKQSLSMDEAKKLVQVVGEISKMFEESKK